ncbi:hypothetical protein [Acetonema longum]|uniref:hypothetical protein n=1 Tax=Acetonema longum TaxID=2374 RepID=UPI0002FB181E|nr:hypothetical protein [Acetonema longum]
MGTKLERISERVAQNPKMVFTSLYHWIDEELLEAMSSRNEREKSDRRGQSNER